MRNFTLILFSIILFGCSPSVDSTLGELIVRKDSLKEAQQKLGELLAETEATIAELDTTIEKRKVLVTSATLQLDTFNHFLDVHGNVETDQVANVTTEMPGEIISINVKTGDRVSRGQVLVRLNTDVISSNKKELENALSLATTVYEKQKRLWDQKIGSEIEYLQAKNNKESLELKIKSLNSQASKATINAPFSGVIDEVFVKNGELANPGFPILRLVNLDRMYIKADVSEEYLMTVTKGTKAKISFPSIDHTTEVALNRIGNYIDPNNRTFNVEIDLPNKTGLLKPNLLAEIRIMDYSNEECISISSNLIQQDSEQNDFVYTIKKEGNDLIAEKTLVNTGRSYQGNTEVLTGLSPNQKVIVQGARNVAEGEVIEIKGL